MRVSGGASFLRVEIPKNVTKTSVSHPFFLSRSFPLVTGGNEFKLINKNMNFLF